MDLKILNDMPPWDWPQSAREMVLEVLRNGQAAGPDQLLAVELAGNPIVMDDEMAETLLSIVPGDDRSDPGRAAAVISLGPVLVEADTGEFGDLDMVAISEETFHRIQNSLRQLYRDDKIPKLVRRRILEASVRARQDWHTGAIRTAYAGGDRDWKLTAVFCMQYIPGFDKEILESLESRDPNIHYQAVCAAGNWELEVAWPHVSGLVTASDTGRSLRLAAIDAVAPIHPEKAKELLMPLTDSKDRQIAEAALDALGMAGVLFDDFDDDEFDDQDDGFIHWPSN